jgi:hypothetical protein
MAEMMNEIEGMVVLFSGLLRQVYWEIWCRGSL